MLSKLKRAHDEILQLLNEHEAITKRDFAVIADLTSIRLRLNKSSNQRRILLRQAQSAILATYPGLEQQLASLLQDDTDDLAAQANYIKHWTVERIQKEWREYCAQSAKARAAQHRRIQAEQTVMYPLLEAIAKKGAA